MKPLLSSLNSGQSIGAALGEIVEGVFRRLQAGDSIDVEALAAAHPEFADQLRELLPTIAALMRFGELPSAATTLFTQGAGESGGLLHKQLGDFRIARELGRGGMGTVFEAEQLSMSRRVALKVLPFAALMDGKSLQRFRNEVRAAAALDHPHIVSVYSVGEDRGVHFFAMQLVRGQTLAETIAELRQVKSVVSSPLSVAERSRRSATDDEARTAVTQPHAALSTVSNFDAGEHFRRVAGLGIQAAEALQHAHDQGVLHRDIKPGNLMLDEEGRLYITDFGLARIETDAGLTMTGDLIGTLRYMSPEQILGTRVAVDQRVDVYSLGVSLYELLTLRPAFGEMDRTELLKQIESEEPRAPRSVDGRIPIELETIVVTAMAKNRDERYRTAQALADDLRAFLENRPIEAQRPSVADRVRKWVQRHRAIARTAGIALVSLTMMLTVSTILVRRAGNEAVAALERTSELLYTADMTVAYQNYENGEPEAAREILSRYRPQRGERDRRGIEWHLLQKQLEQPGSFTLAGHEGEVYEMAVFPDRRRLASVGHDGAIRIWDLRTQKLERTIPICDEELHSVATSGDGRYVAAGSTNVYLCDLMNDSQVTEVLRHEYTIDSLVFHADGKHLAAGARYEDVRLLTLDGAVEKRIPCASRVETLEYVASGSQLLIPNRRQVPGQQPLGIAQIWDDRLSKVARELDGSEKGRGSQISIARSSPCGKFVAAGEGYESRACLYELASGRILGETRVSRDLLTDLAYSPDGKAIAVGYRNGQIEFFELQRDSNQMPSLHSRPLVISAHKGEVHCLRFVDEKTLASCGTDGLIRIWSVPVESAKAFRIANAPMKDVRLSPDGALLLYVCEHEYFVVDANEGQVLYRSKKFPMALGECSWASTGDKAAICCQDSNEVAVIERNGRKLCSIASDKASRAAVAFSPDGSIVAIVDNKQLRLCRSNDGQAVFRYPLKWPAYVVAFSHDGARLAFGGESETVVVFDLARRRPEYEFVNGSHTECLTFNADGRLLASGHSNSAIRVWDLPAGKLKAELRGHRRAARDLAFSPDGRNLLSSASDGSIRVWSVAHDCGYGVVYQGFEMEGTRDLHLSLSSNGKRLAAGFRERGRDFPDVLLWQVDASAEDRFSK